jgi:hypothetical protein
MLEQYILWTVGNKEEGRFKPRLGIFLQLLNEDVLENYFRTFDNRSFCISCDIKEISSFNRSNRKFSKYSLNVGQILVRQNTTPALNRRKEKALERLSSVQGCTKRDGHTIVINFG